MMQLSDLEDEETPILWMWFPAGQGAEDNTQTL